jgi:hypothetical protein|tara:strand:+ start:3430 stop:3708 length:279 start_codon:yes stop_codon:yes gene_type:complete
MKDYNTFNEETKPESEFEGTKFVVSVLFGGKIAKVILLDEKAVAEKDLIKYEKLTAKVFKDNPRVNKLNVVAFGPSLGRLVYTRKGANMFVK